MGEMRWTVQIEKWLARKEAGWVILALVLLGRAIQLIYLFSTRNDMTFQILAAQNLVEGHGLSTAQVLPSDLSVVHYTELTKWPPGFSWFFLPFYLVCAQDYVAAGILLSIAAASVLVFATRRILVLTGLSQAWVNLGTLLSGLVLHAFYVKCCTDALAVSFLVAALATTLGLLREEKRVGLRPWLLAFLLFGAASIKYLYFPIVFLFPAYLLLTGYRSGRANQKRSGCIVAVLLVLSLAILSAWLYQASGSVGYIKEPARGWYPENLYSIYPFFLGGLLQPETVRIALGSTALYPAAFIAFQMINGLAWTFLLFLTLRLLVNGRQVSMRGHFLRLFVLVGTAIVALLIALSLRVAPEPVDGTVYWTYVEEARYYGWILALAPVGWMIACQRSRTATSGIRLLILGGLLLLGLEAGRGLLFTANRVRNLGKEEYGWQYEKQFQRDAARIVESEKKRAPGGRQVLCGTSDWMNLRAVLHTGLPLLEDLSGIRQTGFLRTSEPVQLLFILRESDRPAYASVLQKPGVRLAGTSPGFSFYALTINPASLP
jgi:hypothetical protein